MLGPRPTQVQSRKFRLFLVRGEDHLDEILQFCSVVFPEAVDGFALNFNVLFEPLKEMLKHFYGGGGLQTT